MSECKCPVCRTAYDDIDKAIECEKTHQVDAEIFDYCISGYEKYPHSIYLLFGDGGMREYRIVKEKEDL